jgi:hypothetical protein
MQSNWLHCSIPPFCHFSPLIIETISKAVKLSGYVKAEAVERYAGLWLCYDNQGMTATFNSIPSTLIRGSSDWQKYEIVADIPESSNSIGFGIVLSGKGQVWLSNIMLEVVDRNVLATG